MRDLAGRLGQTVRLCGWVHDASSGAGPVVCTLRDHTGLVRLVDRLGEHEPLMIESAVEAVGTVVSTDVVDVDTVTVLGPSLGPPPIDDGASLAERLDWRYLDLRHARSRLVFEVQTTAERAMRDWWTHHGFLEIHTPKLRAMPNQSGRELFTVQYFDRPAYLAQSPQFYKQMAIAAGLEQVFEIGPVFRANPLHTARHDTEFTSVDVEVAWIRSHADLMDLEERWLCHVLAAVEREHGDDIRRRFGREVRVPVAPFPKLTMAEAQEIVREAGPTSAAPDGDLDAEGERLVGEHVARRFGHEFVFVTEYPEAVRPFYHMRLADGSDLTRSFDLLWNGLEVTTGAQREHRYERLVAQAARNPDRVAVIGTYLDFFRHGCPPHGGYGLGLTRFLMCLLGVADVREVTFLPRDRQRLTP